jgi:integrase
VDAVHVRDGAVQLFRYRGSKNWWCRFSLPGKGQFRKSLGTADVEQAKLLAGDIYDEAKFLGKAGLSSVKRTFREAAVEFVTELEAKVAAGEMKKRRFGDYRPFVERYITEYFGDKTVAALDDIEIENFWNWRKTYFTTGPGSKSKTIEYVRKGKTISRPITPKQLTWSTQASEAVVLRRFLEFCRTKRYLKDVPVVDTPSRRGQKMRRRTRLSGDQIAAFQTKIEERIFAAHNEALRLEGMRGKGTRLERLRHARELRVAKDRAWTYRSMLGWLWVSLALASRPTETMTITWGKVRGYKYGASLADQHGEIEVVVYGKGQDRVVGAQTIIVPGLDTLWDLAKEFNKNGPKPTDPLFIRRDGKKLTSFADQFNSILGELGVLVDDFQVKRTSYVLRHTAISTLLEQGKDYFLVAKSVGTSPDMLKKYYDQADLSHRRKELVGEL